MERYFAMALAVGDLFSTWDEWCDTLREFEALTGHKFWKRRSRKVGAAKIRKELKPELVYYEVQLDCKIIHGLDCVDECPSDCSQRCPGTIKLRANEDGDQLRVSKLVLEGTHKDTIIYHNHEVQNKKTVTTNPFADEDNYITLQSILTTASVSGGNSPELYYPPLKVDAEIIKSEILEEDDTDEAEYHHQRKKARIDDTNGQVHLEVQESNDSVSGEVKIQDEFFYFGKNVECQLRHMQLDKALECQFKILEVLAQYRVPT